MARLWRRNGVLSPDKEGQGTGTGTVERVEEEVTTPRRYKVLMHNDHYTTMDFVVLVLQKIFNKEETEAIDIMLSIHHSGIGMCGIYTMQIAETKIDAVHEMARESGFPLRCTLEPE
jgi:ATP-dependent Clp protease adaptor protein ClpS